MNPTPSHPVIRFPQEPFLYWTQGNVTRKNKTFRLNLTILGFQDLIVSIRLDCTH